MTDARRVLLAIVAVVGLLAGACAFVTDDPPGAEGAAEALAEALGTADFGDVLAVDPTTPEEMSEDLEEVRRGMGDGAEPTVVVQSVRPGPEEGTTRSATLEVTWTLDGGASWSYTSTADFHLVDDAWAVEWRRSVIEPSLGEDERLVMERLRPERGEILGQGGQPLVVDRPVIRLGIDKTRVEPTEARGAAIALAELLELEDPAGYGDRVAGAGPRAFVEALVVRDDGSHPLDTAAIDAIPGAARITDVLPLAPTREFARPILGAVGEATAELIEESGGRLRVGDLTGLSGLQRSEDERLRGTPGFVVSAVRSDGTGARELFRRAPEDGLPLRTSLDAGSQLAAERVLADVGPPSAIVAIRPSTGEVLAAASGPGGGGFSTATLGQYAPGSTFKVVSALAMVRSGLAPDSALECPSTTTVDGRSFDNYDDYPPDRQGAVDLRTAVANSCNTAMIIARDRAPQRALADAAMTLGLGSVAPLGVPYFEGSVPTDATAVQHAASMIGQDRVLASPLAMAVVAASVARGSTVTPTLVQRDAPPDPGTGAPLTPSEAEALRSIMEAVVTEGSATFLRDVPGPPIGAKTGTAEYGTEVPPRTHAWMIAYRGDLAVSVFVEDGAGGAGTAGPLLEEFLRAVEA